MTKQTTTKSHDLKTWPRFFSAIESGHKPFEIRKNDRNFEPGDTLVLREWDPETEHYTGKVLVRRISYMIDEWIGLVPGYCVLGLTTTRAEELEVQKMSAPPTPRATIDGVTYDAVQLTDPTTDTSWQVELAAAVRIATELDGVVVMHPGTAEALLRHLASQDRRELHLAMEAHNVAVMLEGMKHDLGQLHDGLVRKSQQSLQKA